MCVYNFFSLTNLELLYICEEKEDEREGSYPLAHSAHNMKFIALEINTNICHSFWFLAEFNYELRSN